MPLPEIPALAARLGISLGPSEDQTKENLLSAINLELKVLQVPQPTAAQHERQIVLMEARGELMENDNASPSPSTDLVPISLVSQIVEAIQKSAAPASAMAPRPDPISTMRTHVKAAATKAATDFTKTRALPFAGAGALIASAYGLRTYFNVGDLQLPSALFYPLFAIAAVAIVTGYGLSWMAQRRANRTLRALYDPDIQEAALGHLGSETADFFGQHGRRVFESDSELGNTEWAVAEDAGSFILNRTMYRDSLGDLASIKSGGGFRFLDLFSTIDLEAAVDDATGLALDRLVDLKIIEPVVFRRRQGFRLIPLT